MSELKIKESIKEHTGINIPLNICENLIVFLPNNYENFDNLSLYGYIESDYLMSEMIEDIAVINENLKEILDGKNMRFKLKSCGCKEDSLNTCELKIQNEENFTKYKIIYLINSLKIKTIETYI